ncbi:MAG: outer membrane beta-barrel protein [Kiritimatiellaeota bacterium]|nr:outer membrane beta-barrel protein [Kiritimatiellota bacterium]
MKLIKWAGCFLAIFSLTSGVSLGLGSKNDLMINNALRLEYDDNIYQANTNKTASFKVVDQVEFLFNLNLEKTYLGVRYRPSFTWWENREAARTDTFQHEGDVVFNQVLTPRLSLSLSDNVRRGLQPELLDRNNGRIQENQDFFANTLNGTLGIVLSQKTRMDVDGRYYFLQYDNEAMTNNNYRVATGGVTLRHQLSGRTTVSGEARYENVTYDGVDRNSQSVYLGAGVEQTISARLLGSLSGGLQAKSFSAAELASQNSPYGNISLTYLPTALMRLTMGAGYSLYETDIFPYANQERLTGYASLAYDLSARLALYLSGAVTQGKYKQKFVVQSGASTVQDFDGTDTILQASARASYRLNRSNWLGAGYGYTTMSSDLRPDFVRNQYDVDWTIRF